MNGRPAARADDVVAAAVGRRFTAAVLRVESRGRLAFEAAYGTLAHGDATETTVTTPFDLASLTKIFVATAALRAVARGTLALDAPLVGLVPEWRDRPHAAIVLRALLAHTSGMRSGADYRTLLDDDVAAFALRCDLVASPGERVVYSDLGFIALGTVLARACDASLATVVRALASDLACEGTAYRPLADRASECPATETEAWRGEVRGFVHDEKAYLMRGVAGHAGLFGTARDVALVARAYLAHAVGRTHALLPAALAREAIAEWGADATLRRGLGWALKTTDDNSCGAAMSRATFGHTGFTGTCVWVDPERDLLVVLLTNAVAFGRGDLRDLRAAVCDAAVAEYAA